MICFCWVGFPQYAARCIRAFVEKTDERVAVVATRPRVPVKGMEEACGCEVFWIGEDEPRLLREVVGEMPRCVFLDGWNAPALNRYRDEVRVSGGGTVAMCDNNFMFSFKECLKALRFRLFLRGKYDRYFVPGASGVKLLRFYGVPAERIATGMYSADPSLFRDGVPLPERERKMIYVGQFIERKNVRRLVQAFAKANVKRDWTLDMYGSGPLKEELLSLTDKIGNGCIGVHDFLQPEDLAAKYREARIFCLPSLWEHWGLVVHEAALSGCVLLLGNKTGAADDLLGIENGFSFNPYDTADMTCAIDAAMRMDDGQLLEAQRCSIAKAAKIGLGSFANSVMGMVG